MGIMTTSGLLASNSKRRHTTRARAVLVWQLPYGRGRALRCACVLVFLGREWQGTLLLRRCLWFRAGQKTG